jgi:hypothetical protein
VDSRSATGGHADLIFPATKHRPLSIPRRTQTDRLLAQLAGTFSKYFFDLKSDRKLTRRKSYFSIFGRAVLSGLTMDAMTRRLPNPPETGQCKASDYLL